MATKTYFSMFSGMGGCEKESLKPKMLTVTELKEKEVLK